MQVELDALLARCDANIARLKDDLRLEERLRERIMEMKAQPVAGETSSLSSSSNHRPAGTVVNGSLVSHVIDVFRNENRPMRAGEIAKCVEARGYQTRSKSGLSIAVSTILAHGKDKVFRKVSPGVYALLEGNGQPEQQ